MPDAFAFIETVSVTRHSAMVPDASAVIPQGISLVTELCFVPLTSRWWVSLKRALRRRVANPLDIGSCRQCRSV